MKGIIEIDMPKSCSECELRSDRLVISKRGEQVYCSIKDIYVWDYVFGDKKEQRHPQCPIKPKEETNERK